MINNSAQHSTIAKEVDMEKLKLPTSTNSGNTPLHIHTSKNITYIIMEERGSGKNNIQVT